MGLLTVPKKYNPPGRHTPMEYPALLTRKEMGLLKSMGGAGKKTRWGVPSFVAPPGTAAGIGNTNTNGSYAGGTTSGNNGPQNTNNPGGSGNPSQGGNTGGAGGGGIGGTNNGPQNQNNPGGSGPQGAGGGGIGGSNNGPQNANNPGGSGPQGAGGQGGNTVNNGPQNTNNPGGPGGQIGGVNPASVARVANSLNSLLGNSNKNLNYGYGTPGNPVPGLNNRNPLQGNAPGSPNAYENQVQNLVNSVKPLSVAPQDSVMRHLTMGKPIAPPAPGGLERYQDMTMGGKFGLGSTQLGMTPQAPQAITDPYGGMGKMGMLSGQTSPYNQPASIAPDPQMAGRLAETRLPGYGVPDLPQRGQVVAKTPGERVNLPSSGPQQLGNINDMLGGLISGWNEDQIASQISYPSEEGQIYGPASLANYNQPKIADRVPQYADPAQERASIVNQWRQNQLANNSIPRGNLNPATPPANAGMGPTFGPETPAGPEGWQQGDAQIDPTSHYSPQVQTTASKIQGALDAIGQGLLDNTPGGRLVKGGMWLGDQLSGGPAYRDDVSLGTDNSGRRTDRAPSGNSYSPGGFGPGGGDRRGNPMMGNGRMSTAPTDTTGDRAILQGLPIAEQKRLLNLARTDRRAYEAEIARLRAAGGSGGGGTAPPPVNQMQWYYPQYQSTWANLPTGLGGTYGRA